MKFRATIELAGKTATGIEVPAAVVAKLGTSKKPAVKVSIKGFTYRSTVASMGGRFMREVMVPADLARALSRDAAAKCFFEGLSFSNKQRIVISVEAAKTPETRERRIAKAVSSLREGRT